MDSLVRMTNGEHPDMLSTNLLLALFKHRDCNRIANVLATVCTRLGEAREKHPRFAEQVYHALSFLSEEHGEVVREVTKGKDGWESRMDSELLDLIAVAMRMLLREYEHGEDA
jgi:hypothetical protein